jgi:hypothetical protein
MQSLATSLSHRNISLLSTHPFELSRELDVSDKKSKESVAVGLLSSTIFTGDRILFVEFMYVVVDSFARKATWVVEEYTSGSFCDKAFSSFGRVS